MLWQIDKNYPSKQVHTLIRHLISLVLMEKQETLKWNTD